MIHTKYAKQRLNDSLYRPWLGLRDYRNALAQRGIRLLVLRGAPPAVVLALAERAALVVGDVGYTRVGRQWHRQLAAECPCEFHAVETEVVVPVRLASSREEPAAATLRPKLRRHFHRFLRPVQTIALLHASLGDKRFPWSSIRECGGQDREWRGFAVLEIRMNVQGELCDGIAEALAEVDGIDRTVPRVESFRGGSTEAEARLATFLREKLPGFATHRKDPNAHYQSAPRWRSWPRAARRLPAQQPHHPPGPAHRGPSLQLLKLQVMLLRRRRLGLPRRTWRRSSMS
jgi:deoxyribodipyrimidine photo-lyase